MRRLPMIAAATTTMIAMCAAPAMAGTAPTATPGSLDTTFGTGGIAQTEFSTKSEAMTTGGAQVLLPNGKTIVGGENWYGPQFSPTLTRLNVDGSVDKTFGVDGKVTTKLGRQSGDVSDVVALPSGKLLAIVSNMQGTSQEPNQRVLTIRYTANGKLDSTYGAKGIAPIAIPGHTATAASAEYVDGKIVIGVTAMSTTRSEIAVARINTNGALDHTFANDGVAEVPLAQQAIAADVALSKNGNINVVGTQARGTGDETQAVVAQLTPNGKLNSAFGSSGIVTKAMGFSNAANGVAVDQQGRVVSSGYAQSETDGVASFSVMRLNTNGSFDKSFCEAGFATYRLSNAEDVGGEVAIDPTGRIVVSGTQWSEVPEHALTAHRSPVDAVAESNQLDRSGFELLRLGTDGSVDTSFGTRGVVVTPIQAGAAAYGLIVTEDRVQLAGFTFTKELRYSVAVARYVA